MNKLNKLLLLLFIVFISVVTIFSTALYAYINSLDIYNIRHSLITDTWKIKQIIPVDGLYDVSIISSTGTIRTYPKLISFGLSANSQEFAVYKDNQLNIINLNEDSARKVEIPLETIRINSGEKINWSLDSIYFTTTLIDTSSNQSYILLVESPQTNAKLIKTNFPYDSTKMSNSSISPITQKILVRTYNLEDAQYPKEDGSMPSLYEIPASLSIYDFNGNQIQSLMIKDYGQNQFIYYGFDSKGRVKYFISEQETDALVADENYIKVFL